MNNENSNRIIANLEKKLEEQQLAKFPEKNSWSISQCLQHLNTYGDYYLPILKYELETRKEVESNLEHKYSPMGNYFIKMVESKQSSKKLKAGKKHINQQETLLSYLRLFQKLDLTKSIISTTISSAIQLNPIDVLGFLINHNSKHINQF